MSSPTRFRRLMSAGLALTLLTLAACGAPTRAIAPSSDPGGGVNAIDAAASIRPITAIAGRLLEPLALAGLTAAPSQIITLESGEVRIEQGFSIVLVLSCLALRARRVVSCAPSHEATCRSAVL